MKYVVANFKANLTKNQIESWIKAFISHQPSTISHQQIILCPSFVHLHLFPRKQFKLGAQDVSLYPQGAYTGEVTAKMLKELGVDYVVLGHSERRRNFGESNQIVLRKVKQALKYQITPIVCVDKDNFTSQINLINSQLDNLSIRNLIYAYEPPSAIGTGKPEEPSKVEKVAFKIKHLSKALVLYGGSLTPQNASLFLRNPSIDGLLVATASLKAQTFLEIIKNANE